MAIHLYHPDGVQEHGTLLWVGDRNEDAFADAYAFCESNVAQMAYRYNVHSALERPATAVRTIIYCCKNDSVESVESFQKLCELNPDATPALLLGPFCAGARPSCATLYDSPAVDWHQWESFLPSYLRRCGWANRPADQPSSIAVVASSFANASALMAVARSGGAAVVWCRPDDLATLTNFAEIWWDDSVTRQYNWQNLMSRVEDRSFDSIWITTDLTPESRREAIQAGVDWIIAKPGDFSMLMDRCAGVESAQSRRAA